MVNKTLSHIWGSLYLPMFLLRDGSLPLIDVSSLMILAMVYDSLPSMEELSY